MSDCQNCERLLKEIEQQQKVIERQCEAIEATQTYVVNIYNQAAAVLSKRSGVPRGTWSFIKGAGEVAREVYNRLMEGTC